jgi:hypothetical protein
MNWMQTIPDVKQLEDVRVKLTDLYNTIDRAYVDLTNSGRESEAAQLREAADRFARIGSAVGANAFVRQAALQDLTNKFRVAGQQMESENMTKKIGEQLSVLNSLAGVSQSVFQAGMQRASAEQAAQSEADRNSLAYLQLGMQKEQFDWQKQRALQGDRNAAAQLSAQASAQRKQEDAAKLAANQAKLQGMTKAAENWRVGAFAGGAAGIAPGAGGSPSWGAPTPSAAAPGGGQPAQAWNPTRTPDVAGGGTSATTNQGQTQSFEPGALPSSIQEVMPNVFVSVPKEQAAVPGVATPQTVAQKQGATADVLSTSPWSQVQQYAENVWSSPFNPITQGAKNAVKTVKTIAGIPDWLFGNK